MNRENAIRQKQKLRLGSKTFRSIFKSILMLLPVSIVIIVAAEVAFLHMMDRLAEDFESRTVSRVLNQVDLDFQQTYMVATRLKADETILSYVRKSERDYYSEWEVFDRLRAIISGYNNIEEIYLYFPGYEYVLSSASGGKERQKFPGGQICLQLRRMAGGPEHWHYGPLSDGQRRRWRAEKYHFHAAD